MSCDAITEQYAPAKSDKSKERKMSMLAQRVFSLDDQKQFASISGDRNPMHMDALHARRTQAGAPVVHGIHLVLWALESLAAAQPDLPRISHIKAEFSRFVYLGEPAEVSVAQKDATGARLSIAVNNSPRTKVVIDFGDELEDYPRWSADHLETISVSSCPIDNKPEDLLGYSGRLPIQMTLQEAAAYFPCVANWIGPGRVAGLASTSHLVGMICPGLHSIYSGLSVTVCADFGLIPGLAFRVIDTDARFRLVEQEIVGGGLAGMVSGFTRTAPVAQAAMQSLVNVVDSSEFAGSLTLIVGGSRGLGELTAKLIAAGGGDVLITWQSGREDAERVAREIRSFGGKCEAYQYDSRKPAAEQIAILPDAPTHAYYFATPSIFRPQSDVFSSGRLNEFLEVYVEGFWQLARSLHARQPSISLYYPSSIAVSERPVGMTEYAMAKAAGELLCADMNVSLSPLKVLVSRLPRLLTDQTATVTPVDTADPIETMFPIVREVQSWPNRKPTTEQHLRNLLSVAR